MAQLRNWYSNIKLIFLILFVLLFLGFAFRDVRAGDVSSPLIFAGILLVIALVFKPWRTGLDEGTPKKKDPPSGSAFLLAPLLMQDSSAVGSGWAGWQGGALTFLLVAAAMTLLIGGVLWGRKRAADKKAGRR